MSTTTRRHRRRTRRRRPTAGQPLPIADPFHFDQPGENDHVPINLYWVLPSFNLIFLFS